MQIAIGRWPPESNGTEHVASRQGRMNAQNVDRNLRLNAELFTSAAAAWQVVQTLGRPALVWEARPWAGGPCSKDMPGLPPGHCPVWCCDPVEVGRNCSELVLELVGSPVAWGQRAGPGASK